MLSRRDVVRNSLCLGIAGAVAPSQVFPARAHHAVNRNFTVLRDGSQIGTHSITMSQNGDKKTVTVTIPDDFVYEEIVGKEAKYEIEVVQVKEKSLPELDDKFAKGFGAESMDKLREGVENDLKNELEYSKKKSIRNQCVDKLLGAVNCDLPETIVNEATRAAVHNIVQQNHQRGVGKEIIEENKDKIYANAKTDAEVRVKANYILSKFAE